MMGSDSNSSVPRIAAVHDISGFGRSSLTTVIPVLSLLGFQVCPLPTALLSTQTGGFEGYHYHDLTTDMQAIMEHWEGLSIKFDGVYSGFLGSERQIKLVERLITDFVRGKGLIVVDPVLGDEGAPYEPITPALIAGMRELVSYANVMTPNYTEACLLLDEPCQEEIDHDSIRGMLERLSALGPDRVLVTSVPLPDRDRFSSVYAFERKERRFWKVTCDYIPAVYPGTGDLFASIITGSLLRGETLPAAIDRAVQFVHKAIRKTYGSDHPNREGVLFEAVLGSLLDDPPVSTYEDMT